MTYRTSGARLMLAGLLVLPIFTGMALAQDKSAEFSEPVLPDPPHKAAHAIPAAAATAESAVETPDNAAKHHDGKPTACDQANPCAVASPAAQR